MEVYLLNTTYTPIKTNHVLMSLKELSLHLNMSRYLIVKSFFHLDGFPKRKIGSKWYFHIQRMNSFFEGYQRGQ